MDLGDSKIIKFLLKLSSWISPRKKILLLMYLTYVYIPVRNNLLGSCYSKEANNSHEGLPMNHRKTIDRILPEVNRLGYNYYLISTWVHVGGVLGGLVLIFSESSQNKHLKLVACYLPRLHIHELFGTSFLIYTSFQFSAFHLLWKYLMLIRNRKMKLPTIVYLLMDQEQISQVSADRANTNCPLHRIVQDLLYYRSEYKVNSVSKYHLRPTRLLEMRHRLLETLEIYFPLSLITYLTFSVVFAVVCSRTSLFHLDAIYAGCDLRVFNWSYLFRFLTSSLLTTVFLFDTLIGTVGPTLLGTILVSDLNNYWRYIEEELRLLRQIIEQPETLSHYDGHKTSHDGTKEGIPTSVVDKLFRPNGQSYDLQVMMRDFFGQLRDTDRYVSCVIFFSLYLWVSLNAVLTFTGNQKAGRDKALVAVLVRGIQLSAICIIIVFSRVVLVLKHSTERGYKSVCSIMARDRSLKKTRWLSVLEYYIGRPRYAFTFQQSELFTMATLIRFLSYTFTFIFLVQSLRPGQQ